MSATLDELAVGDLLMVTREVLLPVSFALMARPGTALTSVRRVATHPHAAAQCRRWLATVLPDAPPVPWELAGKTDQRMRLPAQVAAR